MDPLKQAIKMLVTDSYPPPLAKAVTYLFLEISV